MTASNAPTASNRPNAFVLDPALVEPAWVSNAWPFEEARKLLARVGIANPGAEPKTPKTIVFETGYGPSGLPHIGTFGEVARTTMVRNAFRLLTADQIPTRLICFSDDMDGMRKVPENVPQRELLKQYMQQPLTSVPDPFGTHESFGHHNNAMLRRFLDTFHFDYEFMSSTECYRSGFFNAKLLDALKNYQAIMDIMLPSLREERAQTYSPFLPLHPQTGAVMQVTIEEHRPDAGTVVWQDPATGKRHETPVTDGRCKLQWKPDWGMRWAAIGVDYEMAGKDHIEGMKLSGAICRVLGTPPPDGFNYELFLDDKGQKISKSKGNGLTIDEWLKYASPESLALFMFQKPRAAKRLFFDVIPRTVDDYLTFNAKFTTENAGQRLMNPLWHIHGGRPPRAELPISLNLLLNLASASNTEDKSVLWGFIRVYAPDATPEKYPALDHLAGYAIRYFIDFVKPAKQFRAPTETERTALAALDAELAKVAKGTSGEDLQTIVYEVGKSHGFAENLRAWFGAIYEVLLGEKQGPRFGSFIELYGIAGTRELIRKGLAGELLAGNG